MATPSYEDALFSIEEEGIPYDEITEAKAASALWIYVSPIIIIMGTVGNGLSVAVMTRKSLRSSTTSLYLICLAAADTLVLYVGLLRYWIRETFDVDVRSLTPGSCKVHICIVYFAFQMQAWVLVNVSLERLTAVFLPTKHKVLFTKKRAAIGLAITSLVLMTVNVHWYFTRSHKYTEEGKVKCYKIEKYEHFSVAIWPWIDMALASLIPFFMMILINVAIVVRLYRASKMAKKGGSSSVKMTTMTAMLLSVSIIFLITTSPICIYLILEPRLEANVETDEDEAKLSLAWACVNLLAYLNNSCNFLMYCLTGRRFREEVLKMFGSSRVTAIGENKSGPGEGTQNTPA